MSNTCMIVIVEFDCDILDHFDVPQWNEFMGKLTQRGMTPINWAHGKRPAPVGVSFDFRHLKKTCARLQGIDLTFCDLEGADFTGSNLQGAKFGSCPHACFKYCWLELVCFQGNISGCQFTSDGTGLEDADFSKAYYSEKDPPTGLPPEILATCEILPDAPDTPADWPPVIVEKTLQAKITIHEVPW